ncbi:hypothetical protein ACTWP5_17845 [Streptomyces sp. 4N509B]|uniref:hypothetical protein n=1 Tax=Streptomyces sp. 4N509B TaxID=3457413 RepID=UPI003FD149EE
MDLVFTVDLGPPPGQVPARHLRLAHAREDLLTGLPSGGHGAKACNVSRTLRVPAWRIMAGGDRLEALFDHVGVSPEG